MQVPPRLDVTSALATLTGSDELAAAQLMHVIYDELRALARSYLGGQAAPQTLQPTALVHEAYLRVAERTGWTYADRAHFFAVCAVAMRRILADHARRRRAAKRGGGMGRVGLTDAVLTDESGIVDVVALDTALRALSQRSERQARVVEYRFFGGLSEDEIAEVLDVSRSTVQADWRSARAWLLVQLRGGAMT